MSNDINKQPPVLGDPAIPGYGSDLGNGEARVAKNLQRRFGYHLRRLDLTTYNARTLWIDLKIPKLEEGIDKLRWDIIGLSEVRKEREDVVILKLSNLFYRR